METAINNIADIERVARFYIGCSMIGSVILVPVSFDYLVLMPLLGIYPCLTAIMGWDLVYSLFGINTLKLQNKIQDRLLASGNSGFQIPGTAV